MSENTIKVLQFGMSPILGGIDSFIINQYRKLDIDRVRYDFVNQNADLGKLYFQEEIEAKGDFIYEIPQRKRHPLRHYFSVIKVLFKNRKKYRAIVLNTGSQYYAFPLLAANIVGIKNRIIESHSSSNETDVNFIRKILIFVNKMIIKYTATEKWACSQEAGEWMFGKEMFSKIYASIDFSKYEYNYSIREKIRREYNLNDCLVIGHVGRFAEVKNQKFILKILKIFKDQGRRVKLVSLGDRNGSMTGDTSYYDEFMYMADEYGVASDVIHLGVKDNVCDYYQAMDCFLLPSKFEGLPVVLIEAQAANLPCFVADNITKEVCLSKNCYFLSLLDSEKEWAEFIYQHCCVDREHGYSVDLYNRFDDSINIEKLMDKFENMPN